MEIAILVDDCPTTHLTKLKKKNLGTEVVRNLQKVHLRFKSN
jgi:hypothetical protein